MNKDDLIKSRKLKSSRTDKRKVVKPNSKNNRVINRDNKTRSTKPSIEMNNRKSPSKEVKTTKL